MRVNDLDLVLRDEPRQLMRARNIERVAQRQRFDLFPIEFEVSEQWRIWAQHSVNVVTPRGEGACEVGNITLPAAKRCC